MLESLALRGAPAFDPDVGADIGPLTPVNFLFGPNGSGKTTISRAFADPGRFTGTSLSWNSSAKALGIKVYNRDYVAATLQQAANLPSVFLLGKTSVEVQNEIDTLSGPAGSIAATQKQLDDLSGTLTLKKSEIAAVRDTLKESAWSKRLTVPTELNKMFVGYNGSQEKLLAHLLEVAAASSTVTEDFDALKVEAAAVFAEDASPLAEFPLGRSLCLEELPGFDLMATPVVGSADVRLSPLIQQLQNADWVEHGRHYLSQTNGHCPFCQQSTPPDLAEQLDSYFDTRYTQQIAQLNSFQAVVQEWADSWHSYLNDLPTRLGASDHLKVEDLQTARLQFDAAVLQLLKSIEAKLAGPSSVVLLETPATEIEDLSTVLMEANASIKAFNLRLQNRATEKWALIERCWVVFVRDVLATEVGRFEGAIPALELGKSGIEDAIDTTAVELKTKTLRLRELQKQVTSSKPIIDTINRLLDSAGFHSFRLKESSAVPDGYSLERENGEIASDTLSEGERTFITFLYFAQSLQGTPQTPDEPNDLLVVIDDPISSLDSDVLYTVSTLIRRIVADITSGKGRVRQLVVLTHNAYFHKEITYKRPGDKHGGWQYGIVRKRNGLSSEVILFPENPIQTAYGALWEEVRRASNEPSAPAIGLQNILRRILETYFKVLGGVDDTAIVEEFEGDDRLICRSLFSWVNAGSHSIFDDLDYSQTPSTVETNLRVFQRVFEVHKQEGHYLMMMGQIRTQPVGERQM